MCSTTVVSPGRRSKCQRISIGVGLKLHASSAEPAAPTRGIDNEGEYEHLRVRGERVDDVVHQDVVLMKMDVEGFEPHVLEVSQLPCGKTRAQSCCFCCCM